MCRLSEVDLPNEAAAAMAARHWLAGVLDRWELAQLKETATLLVSELATNAVQHGASAPTVTAAVAEGILEVGVTDRDQAGSPHESLSGDPLAVGGRGLAIVDALAESWGTTFFANGKQVWFRLGCADWSHAAGCLCHGDNLHSVVLRSGRRVLVNRGPWDEDSPLS